jgi:hypothetical protein
MNNLPLQPDPIHSLAFSSITSNLHDATVTENRALQQRAVEILYSEHGGEPYVTTSLRHFANIQASTILRGSSLEGVEIEETLAYWMSLFTLWEKGEGHLVDPGLSLREIQRVKGSLQDCLDFIKIYRANDPQALITLIGEKLSKQKDCYLPVGWTGLPGHFMLAKIQERGDSLVIELLTKGGGAEYHDLVAGSKKGKVSYKSDTIEIEKGLLLHSKVGLSFFRRLMEMRDDSITYVDGSNRLRGTDLYGLFNLLAKWTTPQPMGSKIGVTPQRSGTCADTGLRMTLFEAIFETDPTRTAKDIKRSMYAFKMQSLVDGFRQFHHQLEEGRREVVTYLKYAVEEHFTRLAKLYPEWISAEELALGLAIGEEIRAKVVLAEEKIGESLPVNPLPELRQPAGEILRAPALPDVPLPEGDGSLSSAPERAAMRLPHFVLECPEPSQVVQTLESWRSQLQEVASQDASLYPQLFYQLNLLMNTLPISSGEARDPYWDQIPVRQRSACIEKLAELALLAMMTAPDMEETQRHYLSRNRRAQRSISHCCCVPCQIMPMLIAI